MLTLDVGTLAFTAATASLASAMIIAAYGGPRHRDHRWGAFALSAALYGFGVLLIIFREVVPPPVAVIGGTLLVVLSALAAHAGASVLAGRPRPKGLYEATIILFLLGQCYFYFVTLIPEPCANDTRLPAAFQMESYGYH